jgi:hypothetical protein
VDQQDLYAAGCTSIHQQAGAVFWHVVIPFIRVEPWR